MYYNIDILDAGTTFLIKIIFFIAYEITSLYITPDGVLNYTGRIYYFIYIV